MFGEVEAELLGIPAVATPAVGCAQCAAEVPVPEAAQAEGEGAVVVPADWANRKRQQHCLAVAVGNGQSLVVGALAGHAERWGAGSGRGAALGIRRAQMRG